MSEAAAESNDEEIQEDDLSTEDLERATRQGWSPKDEWKGNPDIWVDAKTFLKRGDEILPIVRANNKKLEEELAQLKTDREKDKHIFEEFQKFQKQAQDQAEKAYKKELADIKKAKAVAVRDGDSDAYTAAENEEDALREDFEKIKDNQAKQVDNSPIDPDFAKWVSENPWYNEDIVAGAAADAIGARLINTGLKGRALFDKVKEEVQKELPNRFENPNRSKPTAVEGEGKPVPKKGGKTYSDLPAAAKTACDGFVKTIPGYTKEQYLKDYDWSQSDV